MDERQVENSNMDEDYPYLVVTSELNAFASQLIGPNVHWFNQDRKRAEELANMLLPDRSGTSLRLSDHLVVQYSREHDIMVEGDYKGVPTQLWLDYRRILASTGKRFFDVFKRKNAITARLLGTDINTTVGQLTFLCWYQKRGLHEYMREHETEVRMHMQKIEKTSGIVSKDDKVKTSEKKVQDQSESLLRQKKQLAMFKRASDHSDSVQKTKKRKSRAPSRSDSVKPRMRLYSGAVEMSYT